MRDSTLAPLLVAGALLILGGVGLAIYFRVLKK